jgi:hypothetical protein
MTSVAPPPIVLHARVARHALDRRFAHEAHAAVELQAAYITSLTSSPQ